MNNETASKETILEIRDLKVNIKTDEGTLTAVRGVNLTIRKGETLGLVGESGCGKSLTSKAILGINDRKCKSEGEIIFDAENLGRVNLLSLNPRGKEIRSVRGKQISMIFQEPMVAFSPMYTIGNQINEATLLHITRDKKKAKDISLDVMKKVGIANAEKRYDQYPHEFSGGMLQRALIAMALVCSPRLLIADEPTTALDVTIQAQILELMQDLQKKLGMAIIIVTHDLGVISSMCDEIIVMYGGRVCERGTADDIFYRPAHEYTKGLLRSIPSTQNMNERLIPIGGTPINMLDLPKGCAFCPRCDSAMKICLREQPVEMEISDTHHASCWMNVKNAKEGK